MIRTQTVALVALLANAPSALAQEPLTFAIDQAATQFTYSGTTSLGPLVGNPPNFSLNGSVEVVAGVSAGVGPTSVQLVPGGSATVTPDINAFVAPVLPFLPPLATVTITGLTLEFTSGVASVNPSTGAFSTTVISTVLAGTAVVTPLSGGASTIDLTGATSLPQPLSGTFAVVNGTSRLSAQLVTTFSFTDPGTGATATIDLDGTIVSGVTAAAPVAYCQSTANSSGAVAVLSAAGSSSLTEADLVLDATSLPANQFCLFFFGDAEDFVPAFGGSQGNLCIGGTIYRLNGFLQFSGATGVASLPLPYTQLPPGASFDAGETWYFQTWFRDIVGGQTSNTSNAVRVTFHP